MLKIQLSGNVLYTRVKKEEFLLLVYTENRKIFESYIGMISDLNNEYNFLISWKEIKAKFGPLFSDCTVKIIASSSECIRLEKIFTNQNENLNFKEFKIIEGKFPIEAFFELNTCKLKIAQSKTSINESTDEGEKILNRKIKILFVDDSKTILAMLNNILKDDPDFEVVGSVTDPLLVDDLISQLEPDVLTFDIHMPNLTGVELLKKVFPKYKLPTIMITALSINEGTLVLDALELGAFDYIQKPKLDEVKDIAPILKEKLKAAFGAKTSLLASRKSLENSPIQSSLGSISNHKLRVLSKNFKDLKFEGNLAEKLILLGASTGGTNALTDVLTKLPEKIPPILIVQHIPPIFSFAFAKRLNELCIFDVKESEDGDEIIPGRVIVAKGGVHMGIERKGQQLFIKHFDDPPVNRFKPSVDFLFHSASQCLIRQTLAAIFTGMGDDGAKGMKTLFDKNVTTLAQDQKSCVVFGMPREAIALGGVKHIVSLDEMADVLVTKMNELNSKKLKVS